MHLWVVEINFNSASSTAKDASIGIATAYLGDFVSEGVGVLVNRKHIPALEQIQRELRRSMHGSEGQAIRLEVMERLRREISGNNTTSEIIGTGISETVDNKLKSK